MKHSIDTIQTVSRITTYEVDADDIDQAKEKLQAYLDNGLNAKDIEYYEPEDDGGEETIIE
jgi:hypothetical protein